MKIVVLAGGNSTERDVSINTGFEVSKALRRKGHDVLFADCVFDLDDDYNNDLEKAKKKMLENTKKVKSIKRSCFFGKNVLEACKESDIVFLALHGNNGEDGKIQSMFELLGIAYTGSGPVGSILGMDKYLTKLILKNSNIPTADFVKLTKEDVVPKMDKFPVVVKASTGGSSIGVYIVDNQKELDKKVKECFKYDDVVIVEQYLKGREFSVGIIDGKVLPIIEIILKKGFYDYKNKYTKGNTLEVCPAEIDKNIKDMIDEYTAKIFKLLKINAYARVDFIVANDQAYCLEVNTLPGMTDTSLLPQEAEVMGISYDDLCELLIKVSLKK